MNFKKVANIVSAFTAVVGLIKKIKRAPRMHVEGVIGVFRVSRELYDEVCLSRFCYNDASDGYVYMKAGPEQTKQLRRLGLRARPEREWYKVVCV